jgi:hypothetical protein
MKMKRTTLVAVLFAVSVLIAQSSLGQSSGANKRQSKRPRSETTVQGCLSITAGDYTLVQTDPGNTYELDSRMVNLGKHLGEQVEVTGWERPSLATSSDILTRNGDAGSATIIVESIKTIAKECTSREMTGSPAALLVSGAELHISSTPTDADIEIDGDFVGDTPSTVGVAAGQHQLVVKKSDYKPWQKKIAVSSGQIRVDAVLEPQSK